MSEPTAKSQSYWQQMIRFYFAPEVSSAFTILYLVVFSYFTFYYLDNLFLAFRFLFYIATDSTALAGATFQFTSLIFVLTLVLPFAASLYAIFVLYEIWKKPTWSAVLKWTMTVIVTAGAFFLVIFADRISHMAARQPSMQSFVEDVGLNGKI